MILNEVVMAKAKIIGAASSVQVWVSGAHVQREDNVYHVHVENADRKSQKVSGYQHEAAYRALADVMVDEHMQNTTQLLIHTGNDVLFSGLIRPRHTKEAHLHRHEEAIEALVALFDVVQIKFVKQRKAVPVSGIVDRKLMKRPLGKSDGLII